jgi:hypothetical protein
MTMVILYMIYKNHYLLITFIFFFQVCTLQHSILFLHCGLSKKYVVSSIWLSDCLLRLDRLDFLPVMSGILVYLESVPLTFPIDISYLIHSVGIKWNVGGCKLEMKTVNHLIYFYKCSLRI